jgi:hypothetical protein
VTLHPNWARERQSIVFSTPIGSLQRIDIKLFHFEEGRWRLPGLPKIELSLYPRLALWTVGRVLSAIATVQS